MGPGLRGGKERKKEIWDRKKKEFVKIPCCIPRDADHRIHKRSLTILNSSHRGSLWASLCVYFDACLREDWTELVPFFLDVILQNLHVHKSINRQRNYQSRLVLIFEKFFKRVRVTSRPVEFEGVTF